MSDFYVIDEVKAAIDALPKGAWPYLLVLLAAEDGIDADLLQLANVILADAHDLVSDEHMALAAAHLHHRAGDGEAASREWASITYAGSDAEARAAAQFMVDLPALLDAARRRQSH